jgi:hypothetical protein
MEQWRRNKQNKPINDLGNVAICYGFTHYHEVISEAA